MDYENINVKELRNVCEMVNKDGYHTTLGKVFSAENTHAAVDDLDSVQSHRAIAFSIITDPVESSKLIRALLRRVGINNVDIKVQLRRFSQYSIKSEKSHEIGIQHLDVPNAILAILDYDSDSGVDIVVAMQMRRASNPPHVSKQLETIRRIESLFYEWQMEAHQLYGMVSSATTDEERARILSDADRLMKPTLRLLNSIDHSCFVE